jgi:hypothetical protein
VAHNGACAYVLFLSGTGAKVIPYAIWGGCGGAERLRPIWGRGWLPGANYIHCRADHAGHVRQIRRHGSVFPACQIAELRDVLLGDAQLNGFIAAGASIVSATPDPFRGRLAM